MAKAKKYTTRKYDGDDMYSWAVFVAKDVKGKGSPIFYGDASPVVCGMDRTDAQHTCKRLNAKAQEA